MKRWFFAVVLGLGMWTAAAAQNTPVGANPQAIAVDFVAVDANGLPVSDLKPEEVRVKIGSRDRQIQSLELVQQGGAGGVDEVPPAFASSMPTRARNRTILIVLDEESIRPGREDSFRPAISQLLSNLSPSDRVAILTVPLGGIRLDFTTDHAKAREIFNTLGGKAPRTITASDFACRTRRTLETLTGFLDSIGGGGSPLSVIYISSAMSGPTRDTPAITTSDRRIGPGMCELVVEKFEDLGMAAARARATFHVLQPEDQIIAPGTITPGDIAGNTITANVAGLEAISGVTGAELIRLGGASGNTVERILRRSTFYVATVPAQPDDRGVTRLDVETTRPGVEIYARPRIALTKASTDAGRKSAVTPHDMLTQARRYSEFALRALGYVSANPGDDKLRVIAVAEAEPSAKLAGVAVGLFDPTGRMVARWTAKPEELTGQTVFAALVAPAGRYRMRVAATDATGRAATADYDLDATLQRAGPIKMSALVLGVSREGTFFPRMIFSNEPTAIAQVELVDVPAGVPPTARIEIARSLNGQALTSLPAAIRPSPDGTRATLSGVLPIGALPAGDYVIRVVVTPAGGTAGRVVRTLRKVN